MELGDRVYTQKHDKYICQRLTFDLMYANEMQIT